MPVLGFNIYFEVDNGLYESKIEKVMRNRELNIQIDSSHEHRKLNTEAYLTHYHVSGMENMDLIILLHPASSDHRAIDKQIECFSKEYRVITVDLIGHELSKAN